MVSPRHDLWTVSGTKPADAALFDRLIAQPFQSVARGITRRGPDRHLYEMFDTEDEARLYAGLARAAGATDVRITPPVLPRSPAGT